MAKRDSGSGGQAPRGRSGSTAVRPAGGSSAKGSTKGPDKKAARAAKREARRARFAQVRQAFTVTRQSDPRLVPYMAVAFLVPFVLLLLLGFLVGHPVLLGVLGLLVGALVMVTVFGRRVQQSAMGQIEGQVGAAAAVLQNMRGDWRVQPAVAFNREQDLVHRVLGRPGIVLVAEGSPGRTRGLLSTEKKRLARFVGDTPVYELVVGDDEGQVPLRGLDKHFAKLPRNITPKDVNVLDRKLTALAPALPIPKGPVPGGRVPRGKVR